MSPVHRYRRVLSAVRKLGFATSNDNESEGSGEENNGVYLVPSGVDARNDCRCRLSSTVVQEQNEEGNGGENQVGHRREELTECVYLLESSIVKQHVSGQGEEEGQVKRKMKPHRPSSPSTGRIHHVWSGSCLVEIKVSWYWIWHFDSRRVFVVVGVRVVLGHPPGTRNSTQPMCCEGKEKGIECKAITVAIAHAQPSKQRIKRFENFVPDGDRFEEGFDES